MHSHFQEERTHLTSFSVWSSACDFFFAAFPWLFIWSLRMQRREKIMLASSMSLGVMYVFSHLIKSALRPAPPSNSRLYSAGVCGIIRTVVLARLNVLNYTCSSPLSQSSFTLTFSSPLTTTVTFVTYFAWAGAEIAVSMVCLAIPTLRPLYLRHRGLAVSSTHQHHPADDILPEFTMCAPEQIALPPSKPSMDLESALSTSGSSSGSAPDSKPGSSPGSSSDSSPESVQDEKFDSNPEIEILPSRLPKAYMSRGQDSVDEILGLYGPSYGQSRGQIWIKNEVRVEQTTAPNWPLKGRNE